ncbi:MAG: hypothetical protein OXC91_00850 [Rhodobacteraceae bacterium]|nr:hypothetical protein [Paracoccaceae bacterium]
MNFTTAFAALKSLAAMKMIAFAVAGGLGLWLVIDGINSKAKAAVFQERNRYLISLHRDRDAADARVSAASAALSERNGELALTIESIRREAQAAPQADIEGARQCPASCLLAPVK